MIGPGAGFPRSWRSHRQVQRPSPGAPRPTAAVATRSRGHLLEFLQVKPYSWAQVGSNHRPLACKAGHLRGWTATWQSCGTPFPCGTSRQRSPPLRVQRSAGASSAARSRAAWQWLAGQMPWSSPQCSCSASPAPRSATPPGMPTRAPGSSAADSPTTLACPQGTPGHPAIPAAPRTARIPWHRTSHARSRSSGLRLLRPGGGEGGPVDVGQDDELEVLAECFQRVVGVRERGPVRHRCRQSRRILVADRGV
jgi:hypothetical protein